MRAYRQAVPNPSDAGVASRFLELLGAMKRYAREMLSAPSELGMTEQKFRTLLSLKLLGKPALKAIAAHDGLSASAQCIMLDRLVAEGFAARDPDEADRRRVIYSLTAKGREVLDREIARRTDLLAGQLAVLTKRQRERVAGAIDTLLDGLVRLHAGGSSDSSEDD